jgi:hypothetical protein
MLDVLAHNVGAGSLPAPAWLLGYLGALAVLGAAVALRSSWATARLPAAAPEADAAAEAPAASHWGLLGRAVGLALLGLTLAAAIIGPDSPAENVAPVAVHIVWWVGLPLLCLVVGDVMRAINPFQPLVAVAERVTGRTGDPSGAPTWTAGAFLWGFSWVWLAYHRPGSPRVVAMLVVVYTLAAVAGGLRWGRGWLTTGEGFGGLSAAVARLTHRGGAGRPRPPGLLGIAVVWLGATAFDGVSSTGFWVDVLGDSTGWQRTFLNTVGFVWMTAVVAAVALIVLRIAEDQAAGDDDADDSASTRRGASLVVLLGVALVPLATGWFVAHDLTLLLFEGQNFYALLSDPLGKGWDLFGTIDHSVDYKIVQADWVRWVQLAALLAGHVGAVVLAHDGAIARLGRRRGMRVTWTVAVASAASVVAAALLVLG